MNRRKLQAALSAATCLVSIDDNERLVTVTIPAGVMPSPDIVRQWHDMAGDLGYGIKIERPLRTQDDVKAALAQAKKTKADAALARLMLKHGRLTDEARTYVAGYSK
jgi:hypothetical protein